MKSRFSSVRVVLGGLLLTVAGAASAATSQTPAPLADALAPGNRVELATQPTLTVADLAANNAAHARRFKVLMNLAGYDPGGVYCRKLERMCNDGSVWACDRYEAVCSG